MVTHHDNNGVIGTPTFIEGIQQPAYSRIGDADTGQVSLHRFFPGTGFHDGFHTFIGVMRRVDIIQIIFKIRRCLHGFQGIQVKKFLRVVPGGMWAIDAGSHKPGLVQFIGLCHALYNVVAGHAIDGGFIVADHGAPVELQLVHRRGLDLIR